MAQSEKYNNYYCYGTHYWWTMNRQLRKMEYAITNNVTEESYMYVKGIGVTQDKVFCNSDVGDVNL
jgi:hypothetical protein